MNLRYVFLLETMQKSWSSCSLLTRKTHIEKLVEIMKYIINNCNVKNLSDLDLTNIFGFISEDTLEKTFDNVLFFAEKNSTCSLADYTCRALVKLFRDGEFEMTEKDCEVVSSLLLPWGYYVALSYLNKEREKISSAYFDNLEFLSEEPKDFILKTTDIPGNIYTSDLGVYISVDLSNLNNALNTNDYKAGVYTIELKQQQIYINTLIYDLVELILLLKRASELKEDKKHYVGNFVLILNSSASCPYVLKYAPKEDYNKGFNITINFTKEQFALLKTVAKHFEEKEKFMKFAYRVYVEKYGFA